MGIRWIRLGVFQFCEGDSGDAESDGGDAELVQGVEGERGRETRAKDVIDELRISIHHRVGYF